MALVELGRLGIWTASLDGQPISQVPEIAAELEDLGYDALWIPEMAGRDPLVNAALLLGGTERLVVATGIATIYGRDAVSMSSGWKTLTDAFPGRFLLGLGVSHRPAVEGLRHQAYGPPLTAMRDYLDAIDAAPYMARPPSTEPVRCLAALGPKMLALAAERAVGAHPYFVPVEHTAVARGVMGPDAWLMPEQKVLLETDATKAREIARHAMSIYLTLPNYVNNLRRLGFGDDDLADGGSDRLVDAIVAWGDETAIRARVDAHFAAGADHVCVQVIGADRAGLPMDSWRQLAPVLLT